MAHRKPRENHSKPKSISIEDVIWNDYQYLILNYYPSYNFSSFIKEYILKTLKKHSHLEMFKRYKKMENKNEEIS